MTDPAEVAAALTGARAESAAARAANNNSGPAAQLEPGWLEGDPMDPLGADVEPLPPLPGFPYAHAGCGVLISGPTGKGRSSLVQAGAYDAALAGLRVAYLGSEVTLPEFNARAADLAGRRGDQIDDVREALGHVRYLNLAQVIVKANSNSQPWVTGIVEAFDVVIVDPLARGASALDLDFDKSNREFVAFYDRLVQPIVDKGKTIVLVDNIGHATDARTRAKGASAKGDCADLTLTCKLQTSGRLGLVIQVRKVRSVRAAVHDGDRWLFIETSRTIERLERVEQDGGDFRPTALMERVSRYLEAIPVTQLGPPGTEIRADVKGRDGYIDKALAVLITEGYVEVYEDGQARRHRSIRPYREAPIHHGQERAAEVERQGAHKDG